MTEEEWQDASERLEFFKVVSEGNPFSLPDETKRLDESIEENTEQFRDIAAPLMAGGAANLATKSNPFTVAAAFGTDSYLQGSETPQTKYREKIQESQRGMGNIVLNDVGIPITLPTGDLGRALTTEATKLVSGAPKAAENLVVGTAQMADLISPATLVEKIKYRDYPDLEDASLFNPNTGMPKPRERNSLIPRNTELRAPEPIHRKVRRLMQGTR